MKIAEKTARKHIRLLTDLKQRLHGTDKESTWSSCIGVCQYMIAREHDLNKEAWALWESLRPKGIVQLRAAFSCATNPHSKSVIDAQSSKSTDGQ